MGRRFKSEFGKVDNVRKLLKGTLTKNKISRDIKKIDIEWDKVLHRFGHIYEI
jgi:hypothetical protein